MANAIRALSMDAVQKANSGHPGMPMGMADIAEVLWNDFMRHNPKNPEWADRDRFVLSNGHGSMLLYSLLHLTGYPLSIEQIKNFRQFNQVTAGHPEREPDIGIETTTGPLGQGITNAIGMAMAEKILAAAFNKPDYEIVNHRTWVFTGDGCLMEGISHEACSLAGTWNLGKLICIYDDNGMINDGIISTKLGLQGIPEIAELIIIERDLTLLEEYNCRYHISQISSGKAIEIIKDRKDKVRFSCGVSINNLS